MFYQRIVLLFFCVVLATACNKDSVTPYTPEEVLRLYQGYVDSNKFKEAKKFCTNMERKRLDKLALSISNEWQDSTIFTTTFLKVNCEEKDQRVICNCLVQDEYEKYAADYHLIKVDGKWLVDAPEEVIIIQPEQMDEMLDEFLNDAENDVMY